MMTTKTTTAKPTSDAIGLQDLWGMFLPKWYWFVLSLCVTMACATLYLLGKSDIYTRTASVLVKDDSRGTGSVGSMTEFSDLGIFKANTNVNNELLAFRSSTLMSEVVKRLKLNETYFVSQGLKDVELYKTSPFTVTFADKENRSLSFNVEFQTAKTFVLSSLKVGGKEVEGSFEGTFGKPLRTPAGMIALFPTKHSAKAFVGNSIRYRKSAVGATASGYVGRLRVTQGDEKSAIINLSIDDASIKKAEDILNTLITIYNENWIKDRNQVAVSTSRFISERLAVIESELGQVDNSISSFKSKHLLPDVNAASSMYMQQSASNKKELQELNNQLSSAKYIRQLLNSKQIDQPLPSSSAAATGDIASQIGEYNNMVLSRNQLIANSGESNPLVQDMTNSLHTMQHVIVQSIDNLIITLEMQIGSVNRSEATTTGQLASSPDQAKYLLSVQRQQEVKEKLYIYLLQKREENELSQAFTAYNTRIITAPTGSMSPTAPQKQNILLTAFGIGLLLPAGLIFLKESMNNRLRGRKDLEQMQVPFVGELPLVQNKKQRKAWLKKPTEDKYQVVVKPRSGNMINEAFRVVRTNLEFMSNQEKGCKVIMLTSLNPGSGKTFISMNLATSLVVKNKRAIVLDLDLRHASLSRYVQSPKTGMSNYLIEQVDDWRSLLVKGSAEVPDVIPVGTIPPNPAELLYSPRLEELISELRTVYDYIFIDCPPVEIVADSTIISKLVDMTLFVVRAGLLEREMLPVIDSYYAENKFKNMALLLNGTSAIYTGSGYHRYNYRYGYNYGYGTYGKRK